MNNKKSNTSIVSYVNAEGEKLPVFIQKKNNGYEINGLFSHSSFYEELPKSIDLPEGYFGLKNKSAYLPIVDKDNKLRFNYNVSINYAPLHKSRTFIDMKS